MIVSLGLANIPAHRVGLCMSIAIAVPMRIFLRAHCKPLTLRIGA